MISVTLTNGMLNRIISIENLRSHFTDGRIPAPVSARLRKNSRKKSTYASTKIEGNPLTEAQVDEAIESTRRFPASTPAGAPSTSTSWSKASPSSRPSTWPARSG